MSINSTPDESGSHIAPAQQPPSISCVIFAGTAVGVGTTVGDGTTLAVAVGAGAAASGAVVACAAVAGAVAEFVRRGVSVAARFKVWFAAAAAVPLGFAVGCGSLLLQAMTVNNIQVIAKSQRDD